MSVLILQTINENEVDSVVQGLQEKNIYEQTSTCSLCGVEIGVIGGFLPDHGKVAPICDSLRCVMQASYAVMKHNGNGSPVIEH